MVTTRRMAKQAEENGGVPLHSQKLVGLVLVLTGFNKDLQKVLAEIVTRLGGVVYKPVNKLTTHVIANKRTDEKCFEAVKNGIPILTSKFLFDANEAPGDVDVKHPDFIGKYSCKTFENVTVCVSRCPKDLQDKLQNAIAAGGGHYSQNLMKKKTDVVITPAALGDKFKVARQWKIPTVSPAWVFESAKAGHLVPFTKFQPRIHAALTSTQNPGASIQGPAFGGMISAIAQPAISAAIEDSSYMSSQYRAAAGLAEMTTQDDTSVFMKTMDISRILLFGLSFSVQLESKKESQRISKLIKDNGGELLMDAGEIKASTIIILPPVYYSASLPHGNLEIFTKYWVEEVCQQKLLVNIDDSFHHRTIQIDENSSKLLSGFSVFITGYSDPIKDYLGVLAVHLGANIQKTLNVKSKPGRQRINYVISNDMSDKNVEIAQNSGIPIVIEDWLVACCEQNAVLDLKNFLLSSENDSIDEISSSCVATPEGVRKKRKSSPLEDSSSCFNHSGPGMIIPESPETPSVFSPIQMLDYQKHGDSGNCHHSGASTGQFDSPDNQHGSQAKRLKEHRNATSSSKISSSGYTSNKSTDRSS